MNTVKNYPIFGITKMRKAKDEASEQAAAKAAQEAATAAAIKAAVDAAVAEATTGLVAKNNELLGKLNKEKEITKKFEGFDPAKLTEIQNRLDADEDIKLFGEGKKNEVIYKYTERMRADHEAQLVAEREKTAAEARRADAYRGSVLDNQIRAATSALHKGAVDDALLHARTIFSLDEKGNAVKLDANGTPELGKDGKTPFTPMEWIEMQKELKPHWFPSGTGGSGSGGASGADAGAGKQMKRADYDRLEPHVQAQVIRTTKIVD